MDGNDHARRTLIAALLLSLGADALLPREGPAAEIVSASFWLYSFAIVAFSTRQLALRRRHGPAVPVLKWGLLAACVASLFASAALERGTPVALTLALTSVAAFLALVVLGLRDALRDARTRRATTFAPDRG
jgi:hypothetical protein